MAAGTAQSTNPTGSPHPGLLIVTGASHTGKSSVIQALLPGLEPPVAILGVDDLLERTLVRPVADPWQEIPLAYKLIQRQASTLLERGWLVIVESTFTYVPPEGDPELHEDVLSQMIEVAERGGAPWVLCQIEAPLDLAQSRRDKTKRLSPEVVAGTVQLHERLELPPETLKLSGVEQTPEEAARALAARISASLNRQT